MCREAADFNMRSFAKSKVKKHFKSASVLGGKATQSPGENAGS